jgi:hypothetical protein
MIGEAQQLVRVFLIQFHDPLPCQPVSQSVTDFARKSSIFGVKIWRKLLFRAGQSKHFTYLCDLVVHGVRPTQSIIPNSQARWQILENSSQLARWCPVVSKQLCMLHTTDWQPRSLDVLLSMWSRVLLIFLWSSSYGEENGPSGHKAHVLVRDI